jgi:nicotinic acid mononucleotide adenylyltransferase
MKFIDRLNQTAEETAKSNNILVAEEKHLDFQKEVLECKKQIAALNQAIETAKSSTNVSAKYLYGKQCEKQLLDRELRYYEELLKELF